MKTPHKNILFVIPSLKIGGAEIQTVSQINLLDQDPHLTCFLLVISRDPILLSQLKMSNNKNVILCDEQYDVLTRKAILKGWKIGMVIRKVVKEKKIHVLIANLPLSHFYGRVAKLQSFFSWSSRRFKIIIYHRSQQYSANPLDSIFKISFNLFSNILAVFFDDATVFISKAVKNDIQKKIFTRNSQVIHNYIPFQDIGTDLANEYVIHVSRNCFLIVVPGRIHPDKGQMQFVEVLAEFIEKEQPDPRDIQVIIGGGGSLEDDFKRKVSKLGLDDYIKVTGVLSNQKLLSLMKKSKLVIIPSINEGFGNVAVEALSQGCLILSSTAGGLSEIIKNGINGWVYRPKETNELLYMLTNIYFNYNDYKIDPKIIQSDYERRFCGANNLKKLRELIITI